MSASALKLAHPVAPYDVPLFRERGYLALGSVKRAFCTAVSAVKGGSGGRFMGLPQIDGFYWAPAGEATCAAGGSCQGRPASALHGR
jgi:hypothetical protein